MRLRLAMCVLRIGTPLVLTLCIGGVRGALAQDDNAAPFVTALVGRSPAASAPPPAAPVANGFLPEPRLLTQGINLTAGAFEEAGTGAKSKNGWYPELSNMITGSGWISAGPGYRRSLLDDRAFADASAAVSWHAYKMAQGRFEYTDLAGGRLSIGGQMMWEDNTQVTYYGRGPNSNQNDQSLYELQDTDLIGYAVYRPNDWLTFYGGGGWLLPPIVTTAAGTFKPSFPNTLQTFPDAPAASLGRQPNFLHSQAFVTGDTRDHRGHPTSGGYYRAAVTTYSDRTYGTFSFTEYEAEALQMIPVTESRRWVLGLRGWTVMTTVPFGQAIPFYLEPSLGGHTTLRGFSDYRFHDDNLLNVNAESRWALYTHLDAAVFFDAGNVAPRAGDLNLDKTSYGAGLRLHTKETTFARLDVGRSPQDGWKVFFRTSEPLRLSREKRRIAMVPFVP
jgi:hypothetical protein